MNVTFHDLCFTSEEHKELLWTLGEHRRILRDQSKNDHSRHLYNVTQNLIQKLGGTSDANHTNQPELSNNEEGLCATGQFILNKFKRLERERKDWKKLAKSMYVVLSRVRKPHPKKLLEKYLQIKHKYRKNW